MVMNSNKLVITDTYIIYIYILCVYIYILTMAYQFRHSRISVCIDGYRAQQKTQNGSSESKLAMVDHIEDIWELISLGIHIYICIYIYTYYIEVVNPFFCNSQLFILSTNPFLLYNWGVISFTK